MLGLVTVRYFGRLMPLLLAWIQSVDALLQTEALRTLAAVVQSTWPRMEAHAQLLWRQLDRAYADARVASAPQLNAPQSQAGAQAESFRDAGRLLYWCGGDALRINVQIGRGDSAFAQAVLGGV